MPFIALKDLRLGVRYLLTAHVDAAVISSGDYVLTSIKYDADGSPVLGFARTKAQPPQIHLMLKGVTFGTPAWRQAFNGEFGWFPFWPIGADTWAAARVEVKTAP